MSPVKIMPQTCSIMNIDEFVAIQFGKQQALGFHFCGPHENSLIFKRRAVKHYSCAVFLNNNAKSGLEVKLSQLLPNFRGCVYIT